MGSGSREARRPPAGQFVDRIDEPDAAPALLGRVRVSGPRFSRPSTGRLGFRGRGRFCGPPRRRGVVPGQPQWRASWMFFFRSCFSWSAFHQAGSDLGIIIDRPSIGQRPVNGLEIRPTAVEAAQHLGAGDVMAALPDARRNPQ